MEITAIWQAFAEVTGPAAISALWQGVVVALGLVLCLRLAPRISAGDRFRAWAAGFAALAVLPFLPGILAWASAFFPQSRAVAGTFIGGPAQGPASHAWFTLDPRWCLAIAGVWVAASLARAVDLGIHTGRLRRLWKQATPLYALAETVGGRTVEACSTQDLDRPSVIGFFAPRILIPAWLLGRLSDEELEQVVLHETEHLRRGDDWINLAQKLCLVVFPLNPALAWMERRLCREREMACDEAVVRRTRAPRAYAACLASLAERGLERRAEALSLGAWQQRPELVVRVQRILRRGPGLHPALARTLLGVVSCGLVFGSVELARCPRLVAFASRPLAEQSAVSAMAVEPVMNRFHAYNAMALVPSRAELAAKRVAPNRHAAKKTATAWSRELVTEKGHTDGAQETVAEARRPGEGRRDPVAAPEQAQQWVVFTAWEQIESAAPAQNSTISAAAPAPAQTVREYTVTRMILAVYPTRASASKAGQPETGNAENIQSDARKSGGVQSGSATVPMIPLPAAIPVRDGWLVIQL